MLNILKSFSDIHSAYIKYFNQNSKMMGCNDLSINNFIYIKAISDMENPTVTELSSRLDISKASVTQMINSLELKGYAKRISSESDNADKRSRNIELTQKTLSIMKDEEQLCEKFLDEIFIIITNDEYTQLEYLLGKIARNIEKIENQEDINKKIYGED